MSKDNNSKEEQQGPNSYNNNSKPTSALTSSRSAFSAEIPPAPPPGVCPGEGVGPGVGSPFVQQGVTRKNLQAVGVTFLDDNTHPFYVHKNATGEVLFEFVCEQLGLSEKDYFGLFFYDERTIRHTLYKDKSIAKQLKAIPWRFFFEVKFYPLQPSQLAEDLTRHLLCLQLRRDVFEEKLPTSFAMQAKLGALSVQAQFGDYQPTDAYAQFLRSSKFAPVVSEPLFEKIVELHKQYRGLTSPEAELAYLKECKDLTMYGVILHPAKDNKGKHSQIGVSANGLSVYNDQMRVHRFVWPNIIKFSYRRNVFSVKLKPGELEKKDTTVNYRLADYSAAKHLWKCAVEHHTFFRLIQPQTKPKSSLLRFGSSRFRYYGRTNFQTQMASQLFDGQCEPNNARAGSKSVDDIATKGHETQPDILHGVESGSEEYARSPVYRRTMVYETSTSRQTKDSTKKKSKSADKSESYKKVGGVDVNTASSSSSQSSLSDAEHVVEKFLTPTQQNEASLPHSTVHTWNETSGGPETVNTEVDKHESVIKQTLVKSEPVKHTVRTQFYQTFVVDENTASAAALEKAPGPTPPKRSTGATTMVAHTVAYENGAPTDVTNQWRENDTTVEFTDEDLISKKAVTTGNRTVETLTYKKKKDSGIETHVEHRITIHGDDDIDHDAELSRAILEATKMNPEMTVEKVEARQEKTNLSVRPPHAAKQ